jgi:hypothetical protein
MQYHFIHLHDLYILLWFKEDYALKIVCSVRTVCLYNVQLYFNPLIIWVFYSLLGVLAIRPNFAIPIR